MGGMSPASGTYLQRGFLLNRSRLLCSRCRLLQPPTLFRGRDNPLQTFRTYSAFRLGSFRCGWPWFRLPRTFAHLARCAAAIFVRAAALILLRLRGVGSEAAGASGEKPGSSVRSSAISPSICSLRCSNPSMAALAISSVSCFGMSVETSFDHGDTNFSDPRARLVARLAAGAPGAGMPGPAEKSRIRTHRHRSTEQLPGHQHGARTRSGCQTTTKAHRRQVATIRL